jgi:outer membrane lipoprotein-sorting protein
MISRMSRRLALMFLWGGLAFGLLRADEYGHDVARRHAARADGRLAALKSLYAEGRTLINDEVVPFKLWAERPNRLRVESDNGKRRVVQVFDGVHEPWISQSDVAAGAVRQMSPGEKKDFVANADFDGPLVDFARKGYSVDFAGEETLAGRLAEKLLLMSPQDEVFFLWVDNETHEIVKRATFRIMHGQRVLVETTFGDFRDVGGVAQPHRIETKIGDRTLYLMIMTKMEANSKKVTDRVYAPPPDWPEWKTGEITGDRQSAN